MRKIAEYSLQGYLQSFKNRRINGSLTVRECEIIDRMTDEQLVTVSIPAVKILVSLQQNNVPVCEIPPEWWEQVMEGAKL